MERLIKDANEYAKANGKAANLSIDSFSDIVTAIDLIQQKQGIAGTTANEAATTIEGSTNMMKAAWENLLVGISDDGADFGQLIDNFVFSVEKVGENILPRLEQIFSGIGQLVTSLLDKLFPKILDSLISHLPQMVESVVKMVVSVANAIVKAAPSLIKIIPKVLEILINAIVTNFPTLITAIINLIPLLADAIIAAVPVLLSALPAIFKALLQAAIQLASAFVTVGAKIMSAIGTGIKTAIGAAITAVVGAINRLRNKLSSMWASIRTATGNAWNKIKDKMSAPIQRAKDKIKGIIDKIKGFFPLKLNKILSFILPDISIGEKSKKVNGKKATAPKFTVNETKYAKAMNQPYMFSTPTFFSAGEAGDEMLYGRKALMDDIAEATSDSGSVYNFYNNITVDGAENPEDFARRFIREMKVQARTV